MDLMVYAVLASLAANGVLYFLYRRAIGDIKKMTKAFVLAERHAKELERSYNMLKEEYASMFDASQQFEAEGGAQGALNEGRF